MVNDRKGLGHRYHTRNDRSAFRARVSCGSNQGRANLNHYGLAMSLETIVILCCLPFGVSMLLILAALRASRRPAPEPETWAKCAWCSWWYSSEGKIVSKP